MTVQMVKGTLIVYGLLAGFFIFLLWRNASAPDALKNTGVAIASILPLALLVLPYLSPETIERKYTYMLLFDSEKKILIQGEEPNNYFLAYFPMFTNLSLVKDSLTGNNFSDFMGPKGMDLIEKGVVEQLLLRFDAGWDILPVSKFRGPGFSSEQYTFSNSTTEATAVGLDQIQKVFRHNRLISHPGVLVVPKLVLPPESSLKTEQKENERTIFISNPKLSVKIRITQQSGGVQQQGIWGVQAPDPTNMNRYSGIFFGVTILGEVGRTLSYSPEIAAYKRWFESIGDRLSTFDWEQVDRDINETVFRKAMSKILNQ